MALTIGQAATVSYPDVLKDERGAANQWAENSIVNTFEEMGFIDRRGLGPTIEAPLDYRRNPSAKFLTTDLESMSMVKTEVLTAASYTPSQIGEVVEWSNMDEATNPSENQKIALVKTLLTNGIQSHDDLVEEALIDGSGTFLGLSDLLPASGEGSPGGIPASTEVFWRNPNDTFAADGSDIEAVFTEAYGNAMKGSGGQAVKLLISGLESQSLFESSQQSQQRFTNITKLDAGFKTIAFKGAVYIFSQYGGTAVYGISPRHFKLVVSKQYFRHKGEEYEINDANGRAFKIYSALQFVTNNKSRGFVVDEA